MLPTVALLCGALLSAVQPAAKRDQLPRKTGRAFQAALSGRFTAEWKNVPLRELLQVLAKTNRVSIVLDRRIDPTQKPALKLQSVTLQEGLQTIAQSVGARAVVVAHVVFLLPPVAAKRLPGLIQQRSAELTRLIRRLPVAQRIQIVRRRTFRWKDLDRPRELVGRLAKEFSLKVSALEKIPHDLWAAATLPSVSRAQALSLVLIQFDLTFRWKNHAAIEIVPLPTSAKR